MRRITADTVAFVLAVSLGLSLFLLAFAALVNVWFGQSPKPTLGENTTQVMTTVMGGVIGLLGTYIGARVSDRQKRREEPDDVPGDA